MKKNIFHVAILLLVMVFVACSSQSDDQSIEDQQETIPASSDSIQHDVTIINTDGEKIGEAVLTETAKGVNIQLQAKGLEPGEKAMHFHEIGTCDTPDFKAAGDHFNPFKQEHGFENPKGHHAGDLPNIIVKNDGTVSQEVISADVTLQSGKPNSLLDGDGTAIIIHADKDDYQTSPSGNAGERIACGAIVKAN